MIYWYLLSVIFLLICARIKHVELLSAYGAFVGFGLLYNLAPYFINKTQLYLYDLHADSSIIEMQLLLVSVSNLCFAVPYLIFYRQIPYEERCVSGCYSARRNYLIFSFPVFLLACYLSAHYGWHEYTHMESQESAGPLFTITAYVKYWFVGTYLYYLYKFGLDKGAWILLAEHAILVVIDGSRIIFMPVMLLTLYILGAKRKRKGLKTLRVYVYLFLGLALSILVRALIMGESSLAERMGMSVMIEGGMGAYPSLQVIFAVMHHKVSHFTFGSSYVLDPLIWLFPQGALRDNLSTFHAWVGTIAPALSEDFAPMGGFYYIAESIAAFSYVGPMVITFLFSLSSAVIDTRKNTNRLLFLLYFPTIGILFAKTIFANVFKLFLIQVVFLYLYIGSSRVRALVSAGLRRNRGLASQAHAGIN